MKHWRLTLGLLLLVGQMAFADSRHLWTYDIGFFQDNGNGGWSETANGQVIFTFQEVLRTNDSVILYDRSRDMYVALMSDHFELKVGENGTYQFFKSGGWTFRTYREARGGIVPAPFVPPGRITLRNPRIPIVKPAEYRVLELINAYRRQQGLSDLSISLKLVAAAQGHADNMARQRKMDHVLDGKEPAERVLAEGYRFRWTGEIIYSGNGSWNTPEKAVDWWLHSPGHHERIVFPDYTQAGVGVRVGDDGLTYYSVSFGTPLE